MCIDMLKDARNDMCTGIRRAALESSPHDAATGISWRQQHFGRAFRSSFLSSIGIAEGMPTALSWTKICPKESDETFALQFTKMSLATDPHAGQVQTVRLPVRCRRSGSRSGADGPAAGQVQMGAAAGQMRTGRLPVRCRWSRRGLPNSAWHMPTACPQNTSCTDRRPHPASRE